MIASPVIILGSIGYQARTYQDDFDFQRYSARLEKKIWAYTDVIGKVELANGAYDRPEHPGLVRTAASSWIDQARKGKLTTLEPEYLEDSINEGVKAQIFSACMQLSSDLIDLSKDSQAAGNSDQAAKDLMMAVELLQGLKYSDLTSASTMSARQRGLFRLIRECMPAMSPNAKNEVAARLTRIEKSEQPVEPILERAKGLFARASKRNANRHENNAFAQLVQDAGISDPNAIRVLAETPSNPPKLADRSYNPNWKEGRYICISVAMQRNMTRELIRDLQISSRDQSMKS